MQSNEYSSVPIAVIHEKECYVLYFTNMELGSFLLVASCLIVSV